MTLVEKVIAFEKEISSDDYIDENITMLKTVEDVKEYYLEYRGWKDDEDLVDVLFNLIIDLSTSTHK
jgi:hypothetical protein